MPLLLPWLEMKGMVTWQLTLSTNFSFDFKVQVELAKKHGILV
jgi:hypothetical protein